MQGFITDSRFESAGKATNSFQQEGVRRSRCQTVERCGNAMHTSCAMVTYLFSALYVQRSSLASRALPSDVVELDEDEDD